ncbi:MAG: hypothetical protein HOZ81_50420 [Streptomyces sp.]|nr:hypothetical protein [Streptomyces sp.]NUS24390.1 hypothetical protein [Streptomyces sp.]
MNLFDGLTPEALDKIREYAQAIRPDGPLILQLCDEINALRNVRAVTKEVAG